MNKFETMGIMAILKEAYPHYYRDKSKEELSTAVNLWAEMFIDDPVDLVKAAIKVYISSDTKGYPPVIGQIKNSLYRITQKEQLTEVEAWGMVSKAIRNAYYNAVEEFNKLPDIVQKAIGSADRLREWSQLDIPTVQSVIASNFMRSFKAKAQTEKEYTQLPNDVRRLIGETILMIEQEVD